MSQSEPEIIQKFLERVDRGDFKNSKVIYRIAGGVQGSYLSEEISFFGGGNVRLRRKDQKKSGEIQEGSRILELAEIRTLFKQVGVGIGNEPRSELGFLPDSLIGSIDLVVEDNKITRYFLALEEDRVLQDKSIAPEMSEAIRNIERISQELGDNSNG